MTDWLLIPVYVMDFSGWKTYQLPWPLDHLNPVITEWSYTQCIWKWDRIPPCPLTSCFLSCFRGCVDIDLLRSTLNSRRCIGIAAVIRWDWTRSVYVGEAEGQIGEAEWDLVWICQSIGGVWELICLCKSILQLFYLFIEYYIMSQKWHLVRIRKLNASVEF